MQCETYIFHGTGGTDGGGSYIAGDLIDVDRNGVPEPFRAWKDMMDVRGHESARFVVRFDDYPGKWMYHCHILDHEDHGMMGILEVTPTRR